MQIKNAGRSFAKHGRYSPLAKVVVVGCYAQLKPAEIAPMDGVDMVLGAKEKFHIADH